MFDFRSLARAILGMGEFFKLSTRRVMSNGLTIFIFHEITDAPSQFASKFNLYIEPKNFEKQLVWIKKRFRVVHPKDLLNENCDMRGAALITFDDGWEGVFSQGLPIMEKMDVPFVAFINARSFVENRPLAASFATFLYLHKEVYSSQMKGLKSPYHFLSLTPDSLKEIEKKLGGCFSEEVLQYQGKVVDFEMLKHLEKHPLLCIGNHLFDHWSTAVLDESEFNENYQLNENKLCDLKNYLPLFAFPYGQPNVAYTEKNIDWARSCGAVKVLSGFPSINGTQKAFELHRVSLLKQDTLSLHLWFRLGRASRNCIGYK